MHEDFFAEIDAAWRWPQPAKLRLSVIGSAALMMQFDYRRPTNDGDVLETLDLTQTIREQLLTLAGKGTELHRRRGMYLDVVANGIPFLAHTPRWRPLAEPSQRLSHFELVALDVVDVVVSKLKRFHGNDRRDVSSMIERGLIAHDVLVARFRSAVDIFAYDARADDLPAIVRNFHTVERDFLLVPETEIALPSWI